MNTHAPLPPLSTPICRLVMGTSFGGSLSYAEACRLFDAYVERGGNCFDTALVYYDSELMLGRWMRERGNVDRMKVIGKVAHPDGDGGRVNPECIRADLDQTLASLQQDRLGLLMLHRDDPSEPVGPILEELERLQAAGRIEGYAASNWTVDRLEEAGEYARANRLSGFAASSVYYSLAVPTELPWPGCVSARDVSSEAWYAKTRMPLLAWSALGFGFFADSALRSNDAAADGPHDATGVDLDRVFSSPSNRRRREQAAGLARKKGVNPTQIALAWLLHQPLNAFAVVGPRNESEVAGLFEATSLDLTDDELRDLTSL